MSKGDYSAVAEPTSSVGRTHDIRLPVMTTAENKTRLERVASALALAGYDEFDGYGPVLRGLMEDELLAWATRKIKAAGLPKEVCEALIGRL